MSHPGRGGLACAVCPCGMVHPQVVGRAPCSSLLNLGFIFGGPRDCGCARCFSAVAFRRTLLSTPHSRRQFSRLARCVMCAAVTSAVYVTISLLLGLGGRQLECAILCAAGVGASRRG
eukprot:1273827-Alexandrium_andersonii.AAC.1